MSEVKFEFTSSLLQGWCSTAPLKCPNLHFLHHSNKCYTTTYWVDWSVLCFFICLNNILLYLNMQKPFIVGGNIKNKWLVLVLRLEFAKTPPQFRPTSYTPCACLLVDLCKNFLEDFMFDFESNGEPLEFWVAGLGTQHS